MTTASPETELIQKQPVLRKAAKPLQICKNIIWGLWLLALFGGGLGVIIAGVVNRIKPSDPNDPQVQAVGKFYQIDKAYFGFIIHLAGGAVAALIGPIQFLETIRRKVIILHRVLGWIYAVGILFGVVGSIWLQPFIVTGIMVNHFAFGMLALLWFITMAMGIYYVKFSKHPLRREKHRQWMIRNMSLTAASITLRLWLFGLTGLIVAGGKSFPDALSMAYTTVGWLCWVPNLLVAEWYIMLAYRDSIDKRAREMIAETQRQKEAANTNIIEVKAQTVATDEKQTA